MRWLSGMIGSVFALGLAVSGMTQPAKVVGFLGFFSGAWDPSLALVMAGAVLVNVVLFTLILRRDRPFLTEFFELPKLTRVDWKLVGGSALFGIGWGLAGYCPGPALTGLATLDSTVLVFSGSMLMGMLAHHVLMKVLQLRSETRSSGAKTQEMNHALSTTL